MQSICIKTFRNECRSIPHVFDINQFLANFIVNFKRVANVTIKYRETPSYIEK